MQTFIEKAMLDTPAGREAERIVRACVHCGFCTATCPTYQLLGDELDGPRGRIYLIKSMLEANSASRKTMQHLDRCLTCRACETTCPSGVEYGKLVDIGRQVIEDKVRRAGHERLFRLSYFAHPALSRAFHAAVAPRAAFSFSVAARFEGYDPGPAAA